jgi:hypothetical protein
LEIHQSGNIVTIIDIKGYHGYVHVCVFIGYTSFKCVGYLWNSHGSKRLNYKDYINMANPEYPAY